MLWGEYFFVFKNTRFFEACVGGGWLCYVARCKWLGGWVEGGRRCARFIFFFEKAVACHGWKRVILSRVVLALGGRERERERERDRERGIFFPLLLVKNVFLLED